MLRLVVSLLMGLVFPLMMELGAGAATVVCLSDSHASSVRHDLSHGPKGDGPTGIISIIVDTCPDRTPI